VGRRVVVVLCAGLLVLVGAGRASAFARQDLPPLPMSDQVEIATTLYTPDAPGTHPAIVMFHGLGGKRQDLDAIASRFASSFVVLTVDMRGHGQSQGLVSVDGPICIRLTSDWSRSRASCSSVESWVFKSRRSPIDLRSVVCATTARSAAARAACACC